jgi:hypothetical protein
MINFRRSRSLKKWLKRLRRFASIVLFVLYICIGVEALQKAENPRLRAGLHMAAAVAHLVG